jgi:small-conductance mechanosensitive channel
VWALTSILIQNAPPVEDELSSVLAMLERISLSKIAAAVVVLLVAWVLVRASVFLIDGLARRAPRARFFFKMLAPAVRIVVWLTAFVTIVFALLAPTASTLLALLASVGIALGLGAQDLVRNLIGGIVVLVDRPFQLGDRVRIGDAYGEIDYIGLINTRLTTSDDTRVTIPNGRVLTDLTRNANSGAPDCQVVTDLFLPHDSDAMEAMDIAAEAAYSSPFVLLAKPVDVRIQDHFQDGPYLLVRVKAYVYDHRYEVAFQTDVTARARAEFLRRGMLLRWSRHDVEPPTAELRSRAHQA